ncbi:acyl-CoA thioesterase [Halioglobus maricola]|uniref:Acyl-CoA thioesterase n=1 Tax=Halioglobus maricola TaxID=2601894 RepID=A0A5P9NQH3_9GAMM|nr:thioesterase family protein [Halioglobus maricola]QFU77544.1 acyl-CoA thioesterase [Halioglobus maricola]
MPDIEWDFPEPHVLEVAVQASDIDGLQHTNNAVYVQWCEQVAWSHSTALGLDLACYQRLDRAMAVIRGEYDYLQASREGDALAIGTWIVAWDGRLSMQRRFQIVRIADGVTLLRGLVRFACIELSSGRPRRLPQEFIDGYGPAVLDLES